MDDKPLDLSIKSVSSTAKARLLTSGKHRKAAKEDKPPAKRASSQVNEYSTTVENNDETFKRDSMKSGLVFQKSEEKEISESQDPIPEVPVKRKLSEGSTSNSRVKRHKDLEFASDVQIKNKPRILAEPGCSEISSRDCISPKPSTSTGLSYSHQPSTIRWQQPDISQKPRFFCERCSKSYSSRSGLNSHYQSHDVEKTFKCDHCKKMFGTKKTLEEHIIRCHTDERSCTCNKCEKSFAAKCTLTRHSKIHTGEKPFRCEYCGKCFCRTDRLERHIRRHTDDRRFVCTDCSKAFHTKQELERHSSIHSGEKPFKCRYCSKACAQKHNLTSHEKSHEGQKK